MDARPDRLLCTTLRCSAPSRRRFAWVRTTLGLVLAAAALAAQAQASVPWTPDASARHALELLVDEAGLELTTMHWPLPRRAVAQALDRLPTALTPALAEARERVRSALARGAGGALTVTLRGPQDMLAGFGDDATRGSSVAARSPAAGGAHWAAQVGARLDPSDSADRGRSLSGGTTFRLDDSALVAERYGVQLQAWAHRSWWGPGWQNSLVLGNNAPALRGVGLQRAAGARSESPWLAWLGPWNVELFVARTEAGGDPADPYLVGQRLSLRPFAHLEIGLTRSAQWGGRGRDQSWRSFVRMLAGRGVNPARPDQRDDDPANQMAGYDLRLRCPAALRCAGYLQLIGEDEAGMLPSHLLGLYGLEGWSADGRHRYFAEYSETGCRTPIGRPALTPCAYRNHAYPRGYTDDGRWLGAGVGPDSRLLTLGWLASEGDGGASALRLHYGRVGSRIGRFSARVGDPQTSGRLIAVAAQRRFRWGPADLTPELAWQRLSAPAGTLSEARIGVTLQVSLETVLAAVAR